MEKASEKLEATASFWYPQRTAFTITMFSLQVYKKNTTEPRSTNYATFQRPSSFSQLTPSLTEPPEASQKFED